MWTAPNLLNYILTYAKDVTSLSLSVVSQSVLRITKNMANFNEIFWGLTYVTSNSSHVYILVAIIITMRMQEFLPRDAMRKRVLCCRPMSVCLSRWCTVSTRLKISSNLFLGPVAPHHSSFFYPSPGTKFFSEGAKYMGWERFAIFDPNRHLSRTRYTR